LSDTLPPEGARGLPSGVTLRAHMTSADNQQKIRTHGLQSGAGTSIGAPDTGKPDLDYF
jgi:hypothetical protein